MQAIKAAHPSPDVTLACRPAERTVFGSKRAGRSAWGLHRGLVSLQVAAARQGARLSV